jgi:hypothetical protein
MDADQILSTTRVKTSHPGRFWMDPDGAVMLVKDREQGVAPVDTASVTECVRVRAKTRGKA